VRVDFTKGAVGTLHSHPHRQVSYVAAGRFEVQIGGAKATLAAGDSFFVPPDGEHGVVALEAGTLIDVFAPARSEWLR
jgi:quercetin dioxygenase-like cupin family protein